MGSDRPLVRQWAKLEESVIIAYDSNLRNDWHDLRADACGRS
jgi:hypothetical protein